MMRMKMKRMREVCERGDETEVDDEKKKYLRAIDNMYYMSYTRLNV